jgi:hypothetical protein
VALIHSELWDEQAGFYDYRNFNGTFRKALLPTGFFPLMLPNVTADRVAMLITRLTNASEFGTRVPLPTVAASDPTFSTNMWRGAMWINVNCECEMGVWGVVQLLGKVTHTRR